LGFTDKAQKSKIYGETYLFVITFKIKFKISITRGSSFV